MNSPYAGAWYKAKQLWHPPYVGVTWYKRSELWRAVIRVPIIKQQGPGKRQRDVYVGLFDSLHLAAAAREARIDTDPTLSRATRNKLHWMYQMMHENQVRDPLVSRLITYRPHALDEVWETIPNYETDYHVSSQGRVRVTRNWGTAEVEVLNDIVTLTRCGSIRSFKVSSLVAQLF